MSTRGKLPLDDPRWLPLTEALEYRSRQIGSEFFAPLELQKEFAAGRIRTSLRYLDRRTQPPTSKAKLLTSAFWKDRRLMWRKGQLSDYLRKRLVPAVIYVWQPDLEKNGRHRRTIAPPIRMISPLMSRRAASRDHRPRKIGPRVSPVN